MIGKSGKIVDIVGAPASGKSTFARYLAKNYKVKVFSEGEANDFPNFVKDNIKDNKNRLQTVLYFHNLTIGLYKQALQTRKKGHNIVLDTFWLSNLFYVVDSILNDKDEQGLIEDLVQDCIDIWPLPDTIIFMYARDDIIKTRLAKRGRAFEKERVQNYMDVNDYHKAYFKSSDLCKKLPGSKIVCVNAEFIDFDQVAREVGLKKK